MGLYLLPGKWHLQSLHRIPSSAPQVMVEWSCLLLLCRVPPSVSIGGSQRAIGRQPNSAITCQTLSGINGVQWDWPVRYLLNIFQTIIPTLVVQIPTFENFVINYQTFIHILPCQAIHVYTILRSGLPFSVPKCILKTKLVPLRVRWFHWRPYHPGMRQYLKPLYLLKGRTISGQPSCTTLCSVHVTIVLVNVISPLKS